MPKWICVFWLVCLMMGELSFAVQASVQNTLYIVLDGVGQNTFFQLIRKKKLPAIQSVIQRGNVRTMALGTSSSNHDSAYASILTGKKLNVSGQPIWSGHTILEWVAKHYPNINVAILPTKSAYHPSVASQLSYLQGTPIQILPEETRTASTATKQIINYLSLSPEKPFFVCFNITDVDNVGHQLRADGEEYSLALRRVDRALNQLFSYLKKTDRWDKTDILIVSPYAFNSKTQKHQNTHDVWIVSSEKVYRKGALTDIVPSLKARFLEQPSWAGVQTLFKPIIGN